MSSTLKLKIFFPVGNPFWELFYLTSGVSQKFYRKVFPALVFSSEEKKIMYIWLWQKPNQPLGDRKVDKLKKLTTFHNNSLITFGFCHGKRKEAIKVMRKLSAFGEHTHSVILFASILSKRATSQHCLVD
jgi:hypothetical protein